MFESDAEAKTKMISLRISEAEYDFLKTRFRVYGTRSASDFARLALQRMMSGATAVPNEFAAKLMELDHRLTVLESRICANGNDISPGDGKATGTLQD